MVKEKTVYVLDDDNSARNGLSRLLRIAGFNVLSFSNASSFLNELKPNASGTLLTDLRMPGLTIEDLAKELKCRESNINIIIVSGDDDDASKKIAKSIGAIGYFRKPVDGTALIDAINWSLKNNNKK
jgi:two-component system response regulator FixJ